MPPASARPVTADPTARRWLVRYLGDGAPSLCDVAKITITAFVDQGEEALRSELERWEPDIRATVATALAEVA